MSRSWLDVGKVAWRGWRCPDHSPQEALTLNVVPREVTGVCEEPAACLPHRHGGLSPLLTACPPWPHLILTVELLVGNVGGQVRVQESTEGQPVVPAAAKVGDVDILQEKKENM